MKVQTMLAIVHVAIFGLAMSPAQDKSGEKSKGDPAKLDSHTLEVLNASPSLLSPLREFNPVALVRAVNCLQSLGKEKALSDLRAFLKTEDKGANKESDLGSLEERTNKAHLIVRLLFEPDNPKQERPDLRIQYYAWDPEPKDFSLWPNFPLVLQDDLPFLVQWAAVMAPGPEGGWLDDHLGWAARHGKIRSKPLRPADDPLTAADKFMDKLMAKGLERAWGRAREQAWQAIAEVVRQNAKLPSDFPKLRPYILETKILDLHDDADWDRLKKIASTLKIRWSEKEQKYVVEK